MRPHGDFAVITACGDDVSPVFDCGSAHLFARNGSSFSQVERFVAADASGNDLLGFDAAFEDGTILLGAADDGVGTSFDQTMITTIDPLIHQAPLVGDPGQSWFGWNVALSGETAIVGVPVQDLGDRIGAAYVFTRSGSTWTQQARLNGNPNDIFFGWSVGLSGDVTSRSRIAPSWSAPTSVTLAPPSTRARRTCSCFRARAGRRRRDRR